MFRSKTSNDVIDVGGPSSSANENSSPSSAGRSHPSGELLLQWIDHYEEAVTNHYSPELRARVSAVRPNGLSGELLSPPSASLTYRLASKAGGYKVQSIRHFLPLFNYCLKTILSLSLDVGCGESNPMWLARHRVPRQIHVGQPVKALQIG